MLPFINKQPVAVSAAVRSVLYALVLLGIVQLAEEQLAAIAIALEMVLGLFVWNASTPTSEPTLKAGTVVSVQDSSDSVTIQPSPPGPTGHDNVETDTPGFTG